ncbi:hypothetical protein C1646_661180 [Rhizophagus diaphanus]|nr:hypothetical protein C1646_661180 [Rhizophagus diaphanus] [Rhizophagus sp. MUCL 43196]
MSEQWIDLHMACPVRKYGCSSLTNPVPSSWYHSSCGTNGIMQISTQARLRCKSCYSSGHWKGWGFSCSRHPFEYEDADIEDFLRNVSFATGLRAKSTYEKMIVAEIVNKLTRETLGI